MIKHLTFPDFEVEQMEFSQQQKKLKIYVEGAILSVEKDISLGKGILYFNNWDCLTIDRFNPHCDSWSRLNESEAESLKDLCEVDFSCSIVFLSGFGRQTGQWLEWKIINAKMRAEFVDRSF
jgi:hypothetical protein